MSHPRSWKQDFISALTHASKDPVLLDAFLVDILTRAEYEDVLFRWRILHLLHAGVTQRVIAKKLHVSIAKVTRGSRLLQKRSATGAREILNLLAAQKTEEDHG